MYTNSGVLCTNRVLALSCNSRMVLGTCWKLRDSVCRSFMVFTTDFTAVFHIVFVDHCFVGAGLLEPALASAGKTMFASPSPRSISSRMVTDFCFGLAASSSPSGAGATFTFPPLPRIFLTTLMFSLVKRTSRSPDFFSSSTLAFSSSSRPRRIAFSSESTEDVRDIADAVLGSSLRVSSTRRPRRRAGGGSNDTD